MLPETCDLDYIYAPLTAYRSAIFKHLYNTIPQNADVLDLGSGAVGFYWALGYLGNAASVSFADRHPDIITQLSTRIEQLTPDEITEEFSDVLDLAASDDLGGQEINPESWLYGLHDKLAGVDVIDALTDKPQGQYDAVIAAELFDCADTQEELQAMMEFCAGSLKTGGVLTGCCLNYKDWDAALEALAEDKLAGRLNPSSSLLAEAAEDAGLDVRSMMSIETGMAKYPRAHFFAFYK